MKASDLDFDLPPELIAQAPAPDRPASRLLHYRREDRSIVHRQFSDLPSLLRAGDNLVLNDTRVVPAKFVLLKETGGRVEGLFLNEIEPGRWEALLKNLGRPCANAVLRFAEAPNVRVRILSPGEAGLYRLAVETEESAGELLDRIGRMPLPPYIKRDKSHDPRDESDRLRYQTVYADQPGSVAAPTAGLHFNEGIFRRLDEKGIERAFVTLKVGMGTFKPVTADVLADHVMHTELYSISPVAADAINRARASGRRIVAVGTTSARVLESQPTDQPILASAGSTSIFIHPPYRWKFVDAMLTNFHLPRSTLIALVAAMTGLDEQRRIYREAIRERYRFFSYGDAMLIE